MSDIRFTMMKGLDVDDKQFGQSSWAYTGRFAFHRLYGQSKLAQIYHARAVTSEAVVGYSLHPGTVNTEITRYHKEGMGEMFTRMIETMISSIGRTPYQGAQTILHCVLTDAKLLTPGGYYDNCDLLVDYRMKNWYSNPRHQVALKSYISISTTLWVSVDKINGSFEEDGCRLSELKRS